VYSFLIIYVIVKLCVYRLKKTLLSFPTRVHSISLGRSENIAFRLHRGRSAEDPCGSQGSEGTGWAPSKGMIDFPFRGRRAPGEMIDFSFYLHRGRSAEDARGSRGSGSTPASKFWAQATANDPRKTPRKSFGATGSISSRGACLPALWACGGSTGWRATGWPPGGGPPGGYQYQKNCFACTAEDPQKTPAEVITKCPAPATDLF
jgi:hypothetical protein